MNTVQRAIRRFITTIKPGHERWDVKTGTDSGAAGVNLTPTMAAITDLIALPAPRNPTARCIAVESATYQLSATIVSVHLESDGDYHLVLQDAGGNTMIAEIPDPAFVGSSSPWKRQIDGARYYGEQLFGDVISASPLRVNRAVSIIGVGFFDKIHGQAGVARNGIELHPVLFLASQP